MNIYVAVIPAKAGIQSRPTSWIPAFAGMTVLVSLLLTPAGRVFADSSQR